MAANWKAWYPFQSIQVREIWEHLSLTEQRNFNRRNGLYGIWVAFTFAIPLYLTIIYWGSSFAMLAMLLIIIHFAFIPVWQKMQKRFYASTDWAKTHGFSNDNLKLFSFRR